MSIKLQNLQYPSSLDGVILEVRPTVVLIDMQNEFLKYLPKNKVEKLVKNQQKVLNLCCDCALPVAVLEFYEEGPILPELIKSIDNVPLKNYFSKSDDDGFTDLEFTQQVSAWGNSNLFLMGVNASACVLKTAYSARRLGYNVISSDCVLGDVFGLRGLDLARTWFIEKGRYI